jgi:hypothetical protein
MSEAFFRRLKHASLFTKGLLDLETLLRLTDAYVKDHNELIPHSTHAGATPAEVFSKPGSQGQSRPPESIPPLPALRARSYISPNTGDPWG